MNRVDDITYSKGDYSMIVRNDVRYLLHKGEEISVSESKTHLTDLMVDTLVKLYADEILMDVEKFYVDKNNKVISSHNEPEKIARVIGVGSRDMNRVHYSSYMKQYENSCIESLHEDEFIKLIEKYERTN